MFIVPECTFKKKKNHLGLDIRLLLSVYQSIEEIHMNLSIHKILIDTDFSPYDHIAIFNVAGIYLLRTTLK